MLVFPRPSRHHAILEQQELLYVEVDRHGGQRRYCEDDINPVYDTTKYVKPKWVRDVYVSPSKSSRLPLPPRCRHQAYIQLDPTTLRHATKRLLPQEQSTLHLSKCSQDPSVLAPSVLRPKSSHSHSSKETVPAKTIHRPETQFSAPVSWVTASVSRVHPHSP